MLLVEALRFFLVALCKSLIVRIAVWGLTIVIVVFIQIHLLQGTCFRILELAPACMTRIRLLLHLLVATLE